MKKLLQLLVAIPLTLGVAAAPALAEGTGDASPAALARPVHADATFSYVEGEPATFLVDAGDITAIDGGTLVLTRADGVEVTATLADDACVYDAGVPATSDALSVGADALIISSRAEDGSLTALVARTGTPLFRWDEPGCGLFRGAYHGDLTVTFADGHTRDLDWDRGIITGIAPHAIRVRARVGEPVVAATGMRTRVFGAPSYRALRLGDPVWMLSTPVDGAGTPSSFALVIRRFRL